MMAVPMGPDQFLKGSLIELSCLNTPAGSTRGSQRPSIWDWSGAAENMSPSWTAMTSLLRYRRAGYFDESLRTAQDHDMALRIAEVAKMGYLGDFLFYYRRHDDSISQKNAKTRWKNGYRILRKAMSRYPYRYATIIGRFAVLNFRLAQCYCEEHKYIRAGCLFLASGLCDPKRAMGVILGHEKVNGPH